MKVVHSRGSYEITWVGVDDLHQTMGPGSFVVTDEGVARHWRSLIPEGAPCLVLPQGEASKSLIWLERVCSWLASQGASRSSTLVAFGGGVVGDLVGFAAAAYMRGIPYTQVPSTLLAQVDSSVGGKVAVDIPEGKNLVGAFHPPTQVLIAHELLGTLSPRQFRNGLAEVCKTGFIGDADLADELLREPLAAGDERIPAIVRKCVQYKAAVVQEDEFETKGLRATLNFGHTVGHAIEQITGYGPILHGEAISIGMVAEARLGEALGVTAHGTSAQVMDSLAANGLPTAHPVMKRHQELLQSMRRDKKAKQGNLAFSLLTSVGGCKLVEGVDEADVVRALQEP